jgi:hypothetical protein
MKILKRYHLMFDESEQQRLFKSTSLHYIGVEDSYKYDEERGCYVAACPEKETEEFYETHRRINRGCNFMLEIEVDPLTATIVKVQHIEDHGYILPY